MWSMPRSVLRVVAVLIGLCAVSGFVLGLEGTPEQGHLPGEVVKGAGAQALDAQEAQPLQDSVPQEAAKVEEKKKPDDKKPPVDPLDAQAQAAAAPAAVTPPPAAIKPKPGEDKVGELLEGVSPPPEDPPH